MGRERVSEEQLDATVDRLVIDARNRVGWVLVLGELRAWRELGARLSARLSHGEPADDMRGELRTLLHEGIDIDALVRESAEGE